MSIPVLAMPSSRAAGGPRSPMLVLLLAGTVAFAAPGAGATSSSTAASRWYTGIDGKQRSTSIDLRFAAWPRNPQGPSPEAVARALEAWFAEYRRGRIDLSSQDEVPRSRLLAMVPGAARPARLDRRGEFEALVRLAEQSPTLATAKPLLRIAAVGLADSGRGYDVRMAPYLVRATAEAALRRHAGTAVKAWLLDVATGSAGATDADAGPALRAAALRMLGDHADPVFRCGVERALDAEAPCVRLAAAEALFGLGRAPTLDVLAAALQRESHSAVVQALGRTMRHIVARHGADLGARTLHEAVQQAIAALGRSGWQADAVLVEFLGSFRTLAAIPALIGVLERCAAGGARGVAIASTSSHLRDAAHRALKRLTGAIYPAEDPKAWREFWERERGTFQLSRSEPPPDGSTSASGFFGIPVRGSRVVFVIDVSGSMGWAAATLRSTIAATTPSTGDGSGERRTTTRLELAKKELCAAVEALPADTMFNVVVFATGVRKWQPHLVQATPSRKQALFDMAARLQADGATNLWGGVREALQIESLVVGDLYATPVDELFVLSDGAPTAGEIVDPETILRVVTETNRFSRVHVNCVFLGDAAEAPLMQQLAEQNHGRFVRP